MILNWMTMDYFSLLLQKDSRAHEALELLVDDLHSDKTRTIGKFLNHSGSEDFLWGLVRLLGNANTRVAGNSAFIIGTLAESEVGRFRVISLTKSKHKDAGKILTDLTKMLTFNDVESIMNAAGTMGTLAESNEGRSWMLQEPSFPDTLTHITALLLDENLWTASNAALVLARVSISEEGTQSIICHPSCHKILTSLVQSLGVDEAGRGMNAAFAIGRICDSNAGRVKLLSSVESEKMVTALSKMLCGSDPGASKNACFALSCLAADREGHSRILKNSNLELVLKMLSELLSSEDTETGWFSAMTLKTLAVQPKGCIKLRENYFVEAALKAAQARCDASPDLIEEVEETLEILQRLGKPSAPDVQVSGSDSVEISWQKLTTKSGLEVKYQVYEGNVKVYDGQDQTFTMKNLQPFTSYSFRVRGYCEKDDGPFSDTVTTRTEESVPGPPVDVTIIGRTATQLKVSWQPPEDTNGLLKGYYVYNGKAFVEHTQETTSIISSLQPATDYEIHVCAANGKGKGPKDSVIGTTSELGAHAPSKPEIVVRGRNEMQVSWKPPEVPLGRISRYDLMVDGEVIYSGTEQHHIARRLRPDTEYTFMVCAITSEGRCESKTAKKRTAKDGFDGEREPLYKPPKRDKTEKSEDKNYKDKFEPNPERRNSIIMENDKDKKHAMKNRKSTVTPSSSPCNNTPIPVACQNNERPPVLSPKAIARVSSAKGLRKVMKKPERNPIPPGGLGNKPKENWMPDESLPPSAKGSQIDVDREIADTENVREDIIPPLTRTPRHSFPSVMRNSNAKTEIDISRSISSLASRSSSPRQVEVKGKENILTQQTDSLPKPQPPKTRSNHNQLSNALQRSTTSMTDYKSEHSTNYEAKMENNAKLRSTQPCDSAYDMKREYTNVVETFVNDTLHVSNRTSVNDFNRKNQKRSSFSSVISSNQWMQDLPTNSSVDHAHTKFVPSQFRTQPAHIPGGFHRQVTNLSLFEGGQPKLRIDLVSRSLTMADKMSTNSKSLCATHSEEEKSRLSVGKNSAFHPRASGLNRSKTFAEPLPNKPTKWDGASKIEKHDNGKYLASLPVNFEKSKKLQGAR